MVAIKDKILRALTYPRSMVRGDIELEDCIHCGNYAEEDNRCRNCYYAAECQWLVSNDEFVALEQKPLEELEGALEFALGYVDAQVMDWGHKCRTCRCETCRWLRRTQRLFGQVVAETSRVRQ